MDFFKKRSTAICVFVLVVIVFGLAGCRLSLDRACRKAEDAFFDRSLLQSETYHTCPGEQLEYCVDYTNRLLACIGRDGAWADAYTGLASAREGLMDALSGRDIPAIGQANQALAEAVAAVETVYESGAPLPAGYDDIDAVLADFHGAQATLEDPAYNEHILAFRDRVLGAFPANILRHVLGIKVPETFP